MSEYAPGTWIPPYDIVARTKATYIVGAINFETFDRLIGRALHGWTTMEVLYGSELSRRLRVAVSS